MKLPLGKLEKIDPRGYWKNEARDFTPWLAEDDNIAFLSESVVMDLEVIRQEERVGSFNADILCMDRVTNKYVVIENQLEKTDHSHLGQVITYCSGLDAASFIWVSPEFREEHRSAIDWLNRITNDNFNFFGIEIELFKIGDSPMAPSFKIVSKPNDWSKTMRSQADNASLTDTQKSQLDYWVAFQEFLRKKNSPFKSQKPAACHWTNFTIGRTGFYLTATVNSRESSISVWMQFDGINAKDNYDSIHDNFRKDAEIAIAPNMVWNRLPEKKVSNILLTTPADFTDRSKWNEQFEWLYEYLLKFYNFFKPKVMALDK
ncbi:DUF4268 domain-containing protein [Alistipes indistinctus]|uniref:DUF4268 domain-containing protein n=1 Tax=Alistipes indistinctus TaxID=626932 RepID=UPI0036F1AB1D